MPGYSSEVFARVYNMKCSGFARRLAPQICEFYANTPVGRRDKSILDLCCGTGQLALYFLRSGYKIVGIDLSEHMLRHAEENAHQYVESGQAKFVQADASHFALGERFGLVVATFDSLNHLEDEQGLQRCFQCVRAVNDGYFIFDLNTRRGLRQCNNILLDDSSEDTLLINRGIYDERGERAWTSFTGFVRLSNGLYERFDETAFNTVFEMDRVKTMLVDVGWTEVCFARIGDLRSSLPVSEAENEGRVFIVAST
jgi:SAM-dependent methyltransferase